MKINWTTKGMVLYNKKVAHIYDTGVNLMLKFKTLDLEDRDIFRSYLKDYKFKTYEYSFSTLYLWRKLCSVEYTIFKDSIIIKKYEKNKGAYFMQPIFKDIKYIEEIVQELKNYKENYGFRNLFRDVEESFFRELKDRYEESILYKEDVNNFDYIYDTNKMITLPGKRLHGKKNHYNQFVNMYEYQIRDISEDGVSEDCIRFAAKWTDTKEDFNSNLAYEKEGVVDLLLNKNMLDLEGMAIYVKDDIIGFSIGERVNKEMAIIHIEKADYHYKGSYAFLNKTFVEMYFKDTLFINREEDMGIDGLRKAKESYHPIRLEKKYIIDL
jgi:hypothetical protein